MNEPNTKTKRFKRATYALEACLLVGIGVLIGMYKTTPSRVAERTEPPAAVDPQAAQEPVGVAVPEAPPESPIEKMWGIQVLGLSLTNDDTAIQVLYTVVSPEKTLLLSDTNAAVYLVDEASGAKLPMVTAPQQGTAVQGASLRTTRRMMRQAGRFPPAPSRLVAGGTFSLEIPNWGRSLQSGSKVSLVVGDLQQDHLTVQ